MNYENIYNKLILDAQQNPKLDPYKETHHILPICLGGQDDSENLVKLTARQHFLAHWLLYKIYRTSKLAHAWFSMCRVGKGQDARRQNSHLFENAKIAKAKHLSEDSKGENNWFYGKTHTSESKRKMLETRQKTFDSNPELLLKIRNDQSNRFSDLWKGKPKSADHKAKIGAKSKGKIILKNVQTGECVKVSVNDREKYDNNIWKTPFEIATHSGLGSKWCTNGETNIKLKADEPLPNGFRFGRTNKRKENAN